MVTIFQVHPASSHSNLQPKMYMLKMSRSISKNKKKEHILVHVHAESQSFPQSSSQNRQISPLKSGMIGHRPNFLSVTHTGVRKIVICEIQLERSFCDAVAGSRMWRNIVCEMSQKYTRMCYKCHLEWGGHFCKGSGGKIVQGSSRGGGAGNRE